MGRMTFPSPHAAAEAVSAAITAGFDAVATAGTACDFCETDPAVYAFPAEPFTIPLPVDADYQSVGPWFACSSCQPLIAVSDWESLAVRCNATSPLVINAWTLFEQHRTGQPVRLVAKQRQDDR